MARCYLTGVEFFVQDGYVLNRGDAQHLLRTLKRRSESLERLITQLAPLDDVAIDNARASSRRNRRQYRMICKAVADALGGAYPETELCLPWPSLLARGIRDRMRLLQQHPLYAQSIRELPDQKLLLVASLGRHVMNLIDPHRELPHQVRLAITVGICVQHHDESATTIAARLRSAIAENADLLRLGVPEEERDVVRVALTEVFRPSFRNSSNNNNGP